MSEFVNYNHVELGEAERFFLYLVGRIEPSAYRAFSLMKKHNKISYKNVHKTFMKLKDLGLIVPLKGTFKRNAVHYVLTARGVFHFLLTCEIDTPFLLKYRNDPILQIILYPFFEVQTIKYFDTPPREYFVTEYLNDSCKKILTSLQEFRQFYGSKAKLNIDKLDMEMGAIVRKQIMTLVYTIITLNTSRMRFTREDKSGNYDRFEFVVNMGSEYPNYPSGEDTKLVYSAKANDKNYRALFPMDALMKDKKFMLLFHEMKEEFEDGCKQFIA